MTVLPSQACGQQLQPLSDNSQQRAYGFALCVGLDEAVAIAAGTSIKAVIQEIRTHAHGLAPAMQSHATIAVGPPLMAGSAIQYVLSAFGLPTAPDLPKVSAFTAQAHAAGPRKPTITVRRRIYLDGENLELTNRQRDLVSYLVSNSDRPVSREEILDYLCRKPATYRPHQRAVDVHIRRLRRKLGRHADVIQSRKGAGYQFVNDGAIDIRSLSAYLAEIALD